MEQEIISLFVVVVECIIEHQNQILVITRPPGVHAEGMLAFPGGKVEYSDGENNQDILIEAVKREVYEEVGLALTDPLRFVTSSYFIDAHQNLVLDVIFHCKVVNTVLNINASPREVVEYQWLTLEEIGNNPLTPPWLQRYLLCIDEHL